MTLSREARHDLESMPYTPPEVILGHVGPLWREFLAAEQRIAELTAATNQLATAIVRRHTSAVDSPCESTMTAESAQEINQ